MRETKKRLILPLSPKDVEWAYREVARQHDLAPDTVAGMCEALMHARMVFPKPPTPDFLRQIHYCIKGIGRYRIVNLQSPKDTYKWELIDRSVEMLCDLGKDMTPGQWCKMLLKIHPWVDGNGRVAAIMFNYLGNTLDNPVPLPEWETLQDH